MRGWMLLLILIGGFGSTQAQVRLPHYPDSLFTTYYHQRVTHFRSLPQTKGEILFVGNSITDGGGWSELFNDLCVKNRGISGDISAGVIARLDEIATRKPAKVFLLIGTNDLARNISVDSVVKNILLIAAYLKAEAPATQVFVQSILPVSNAFGKFSGHASKGVQIKQVNEQLKQQAEKLRYTFIDLHSSFADETGRLRKDLTNDGLHLTGKGYIFWKHLVFPHVYGLQPKVSLLPLPQKLQWKDGVFPLFECRSIFLDNASVQNEAVMLQRELEKVGLKLFIKSGAKNGNEKSIVLQLGNVPAATNKAEAYRLQVTEAEVRLTANTPHGIFNGIQTLLQLASDGVMIDACDITDWPAFAWRGYMIDVGRNYVSMKLLKEQIDEMGLPSRVT